MINYLIRRTVLLIPTLFFVTIIVFLLVHWVPGSAVDVIEATLSQGGTVNIDRQAIMHMLGLDVPIHIQYIKWLSGIVVHGDFGNSIIQGRPVLQMVMERMSVTLELGILSLLVANVVALPLGVYMAARQDKMIDYILRVCAVILIAVPGFWIATLVMVYPVNWWGWSPSMVLIPFSKDPLGNLGMFLLPAVINGTMMAGMSIRLVRTMTLEVMRQDYVRTAWSKGLSERTVIVRHAVKNAFIPVVTMLGGSLATLVGGVVIMEQIFNIPGMGLLMLQSLNQRDYPVISAVVVLTSIVVLLGNLLVDLSYNWLDPRVRYDD